MKRTLILIAVAVATASASTPAMAKWWNGSVWSGTNCTNSIPTTNKWFYRVVC